LAEFQDEVKDLAGIIRCKALPFFGRLEDPEEQKAKTPWTTGGSGEKGKRVHKPDFSRFADENSQAA
jgi:hypothetical protein